jgi:thiamine-phosphate pyrophosphorylase
LPRHSKTKAINRIIDANINRTKEGLRVCEEITRFILNSRTLTSEFKKIRHKIDRIFKQLPSNIMLLEERKSLKDVGRYIYINELKRRNFQDIFFANIQRVKESIRVLEEFSKLINRNIAIEFKKTRYGIYEIEKKVTKRIPSLYHYR